MAIITHTTKTPQIPMGDRVMQTYRVAAMSTAGSDDYLITGLAWIDAVIGYGPSGAAGWVTTPVFMINAQGVDQTEGDNPGDLGMEVTNAGDNDLTVTVIGIP